MNRFSPSSRFLVAAALVTAGLGTAAVAEARPEVSVSVGFQSGPAWREPPPVVVQSWPVYADPGRVVVRPPVFVAPPEVFVRPGWRGDGARFDWERERAWRHAEWHRREWRRHEERDEFRGGDRDRHHDHRD